MRGLFPEWGLGGNASKKIGSIVIRAPRLKPMGGSFLVRREPVSSVDGVSTTGRGKSPMGSAWGTWSRRR